MTVQLNNKRDSYIGQHRTAQIAITVMDPIVRNQTNYRVIGNAVMFRNKGTAEVVINGGLSLASGEAVGFNLNNAYDIIVQNFSIMFDGVGVNRLEVVIMEAANCSELDDYVQNIRIR